MNLDHCNWSQRGRQPGARRFALLAAWIAALWGSSLSAAEPPADDEIRLRAEAAFREGTELAVKAPDKARQAFARSAALYDQLRQTGAANADLFRNQGNALLLAGDLPRAILTYRGGLRNAPHDLALRRNLNFAREEVRFAPPGTLGRPPVDHRPPWLSRLPDWVPYVALGCYSLGWLAVIRWWMVRRGWWLTGGIVCFAAALLVGSGVGFEEWADVQEEAQPLVVISQDGVHLRCGNGEAYPPRYEAPLNRGVEARLLFERGRWLQIELAGGEIGWVPAAKVVIDR